MNSTFENETMEPFLLETTVILPLNGRHLETLNGRAVFVCSLALNVLLLAVVTLENNATLRTYANVLKLNCAADLFYTSVSLLSDFNLEIVRGTLVIVMGGVYADASRGWNLFAIWLYTLNLYISLLIIPVVFYFRYNIVVKNNAMTTNRLLAVAAIPCAVAATLAAMLTLTLAVDRSALTCHEALAHPMWTYGGYRVDNCLIADATSPMLWIFMSVVGVVNTAMYTLIIFCTVRIFGTLRQANQTSRLQRQINMLLIAQLTLPILCACLPLSIMICVSTLQYEIVGVGIWLVVLVAWVPLLNPLVTILLVSNYRRQALKLLGRPLGWSGSRTSAASVTSGGLGSHGLNTVSNKLP